MIDLDAILEIVLRCISDSAREILKIYYSSGKLFRELKTDKSPVTQADLISHQIISDRLSKEFSYPILSEESADDAVRLESEYVWIVDPLDGTKEFIAKLDEFTINIALVKRGRPILAAISVPAKNILYYATKGGGAFIEHHGQRQGIYCSRVTDLQKAKLSVSRSHLNEQLAQLLEKASILNLIPTGSALKYCSIASGETDASLRKTPLMEWDICAADCILTEAGGSITDFQGNQLKYNRKNPIFDAGIVSSNQFLHQLLLHLIKPIAG